MNDHNKKAKEYKLEAVTSVKRTGLYWLWVSVAVILIDQVTKYLITTYMSYNETIFILPFLKLTLVHNVGAAFSFLSEVGHATRFFIITALVMSVVLCVWMYRLPSQSRWLGISLALILGGAIGNLLDRISYGYVIDFIHLHLHAWSWPVFNIADLAITVGAVMLIIDLLKKK